MDKVTNVLPDGSIETLTYSTDVYGNRILQSRGSFTPGRPDPIEFERAFAAEARKFVAAAEMKTGGLPPPLPAPSPGEIGTMVTSTPTLQPPGPSNVSWGDFGNWVWDAVLGWIGGQGDMPPPPVGMGLTCPEGYVWDAVSMKCKSTAFAGGWIPGGDTPTTPQTGVGCTTYGGAVIGAFGKPAMEPAQCQTPSRRCPPGAVLGKDNLCYDKGSITNANRKWPRPTRPLLTSGDMSVLRKANALESRLLRAYKRRGFPVMKKPPAKK